MKIAITAANGLIGSALTHEFAERGHELTLFVRQPFETIHRLSIWNPFVGRIDAADLEGTDVVINLAGKNVAAERWTERHKREIVDSRVQAAELISRTIAKLANKPRLLLQASAVGYYGHRPDELLTESSSAGRGFMAQSCAQWEKSVTAAESAGVRVCTLRIGVVLAPNGGALARMLPIFKLGLGGRFGDGRTIMSWITLRDVVHAMQFLIDSDSVRGPVNLTAPQPVSNEEFTRSLGKILRRPTIMVVPDFALRLAVGEIATELLQVSQNALPKKLLDAGFKFEHDRIEPALRSVLVEAAD